MQASSQCNDIMAQNTKQEDDGLSKQTKVLRELYGHWKTKQEMRKWHDDGEIGTIPLLEGVSESISLHFDKL